MEIDPTSLTPSALYYLTISIVIPRPIGWTSTVDVTGTPNLAPFSFFNVISGSPPIVILSVGRRETGPKDTLRNIQATGEFVVSIVTQDLAEQMNTTSASLPPEQDEFAVAGLTTRASTRVRPPAVAESPVSLECKLIHSVELPGSDYSFLLGEIVYFHISDAVLDARGRVDAAKLRPLARLGAGYFATLGRIFQLARPP